MNDAKTEKALSPSEQFDKEIADLTNRRGSVYGHPSTDFGRVARIKAALADCSDPRVRHVLEMIAVKMSRLVESPQHLDSWVDIAGYARTGTMLMDANPVFTNDELQEIANEAIDLWRLRAPSARAQADKAGF